MITSCRSPRLLLVGNSSFEPSLIIYREQVNFVILGVTNAYSVTNAYNSMKMKTMIEQGPDLWVLTLVFPGCAATLTQYLSLKLLTSVALQWPHKHSWHTSRHRVARERRVLHSVWVDEWRGTGWSNAAERGRGDKEPAAASSCSVYRHFSTGSARVSCARYNSVLLLFDWYSWAPVGIEKTQLHHHLHLVLWRPWYMHIHAAMWIFTIWHN